MIITDMAISRAGMTSSSIISLSKTEPRSISSTSAADRAETNVIYSCGTVSLNAENY